MWTRIETHGRSDPTASSSLEIVDDEVRAAAQEWKTVVISRRLYGIVMNEVGRMQGVEFTAELR